MSTPRRTTRQSASSNTPGAGTPAQAGPSTNPTKGRIIVINDNTPTRPAKRARTTPRGRRGRGGSTPLRGKRGAVVRDDDARSDKNENENNSSGSSSGSGSGSDTDTDASHSNQRLISSLAKNADIAKGKGFIHRNAFDAYFAAASKPARTSNSVFSQLVPPLTHDEYATLIAQSSVNAAHAARFDHVLKGHEKLFQRYTFELAEGFNLLFYGYGSKRGVLNRFASDVCARRGHVVVVNGYIPRVGIKDVIMSIEGVPGLVDVPLPAGSSTIGTLDAQTRRIYEFFLPATVRPHQPTSPHSLFLVIHNIDSPALRTPRAKSLLSLLALNPRIHIVASVDHVNAQMIWGVSEACGRKHVYEGELGEGLGVGGILPTRGFAWVWHDMTTMQPYDEELAHVDMTSVRSRRGKGAGVGGGPGDMSESAAQHILASVNAKAKKLFSLLANKLLASFDEDAGATSKSKEPQMALQRHAVPYETLFNAARTDFIATNDTSFRALLAEFRDHGLVLTVVSGGSESLWIPLRVEELRRIVTSLGNEQ